MAAQGLLLFDDAPTTVAQGGGSEQAFVVLDDSSDVLVFDAEVARESQDVPDSTDFLIFDTKTTVVETVTGADFLLLEPPKSQIQVILDGPEYQDVMVITSGGPPGPPGPPGPAGSAPYEHHQIAAAASWTVVHNLGYRPNVWLFIDSAPDELVHTDVTYIDDNTVYVEWPSPESGWAYAR